jgi:hypothetical protein
VYILIYIYIYIQKLHFPTTQKLIIECMGRESFILLETRNKTKTKDSKQ